MKMKNTLLALLVMFSGSTMAENATLSVGWAMAHVSGESLNGVNIKGGYQSNGSKAGFISSLTFTAYDDSSTEYGTDVEVKARYGSLLVGASYDITSWLRPYAMIGGAIGRVEGTAAANGQNYSVEERESAFAYGLGVQVYPTENLFVDLAYEGTKVFSTQVNTFMIGAGWKF